LTAPYPHKLLAWEGIGLCVPQQWDIGAFNGDHLLGSFRVDSPQRPVVQVRWWSTGKLISLDRTVGEFLDKSAQEKPDVRIVKELQLPGGPEDRLQALQTSEDASPLRQRQLILIWQNQAMGRVAVCTFLIERGRPDLAQIQDMVRHLRMQSLAQWRDWGVFDLSFKTPPGYELHEAKLSAGICHWQFRAGRDLLTLRRFSAADALMAKNHPTRQDLHAWCRAWYAPEFHDMGYEVRDRVDEQGRTMLKLLGGKRLLAPLEFDALFPRLRRVPREIDVIWDNQANKIYCLEILRPSDGNRELIEQMRRSLGMSLTWDAAADQDPARDDELALDDPAIKPRRARLRALNALAMQQKNVRSESNARGNLVLRHDVPRRAKLRILRFLAGERPGKTVEKFVELDLLGSLIWQTCQQPIAVRDLINIVRRRFQISYKEAETSVTDFIKSMGNRGLLAVKIGP
jgi:hypothetical protein